MGRVAKLVTMTLTTRVIVEDGTSEDKIISLAIPRFIDKVVNEPNEHIEEILDDEECPYDEQHD